MLILTHLSSEGNAARMVDERSGFVLKKRIFQWSLLILMVATGVGFALNLAYAFGVSPSRVEISLPAGGTYSGVFTITNSKKEPICIGVTLEDRSLSAKDHRRGRLVLEWLKSYPHRLDLAPGESKVVEYTIAIPEGSRGEYLARISFTDLPPPGKAAVSIASAMTFPIYVVVEGTEVIEGDVIGLKISKRDPLEVRLTIKNSGNTHIRPKGEVILERRNWFNKKEIALPLNRYDFPVYPFSQRTLKIKSKEKLSPGRYRAKVNMEFGPERVLREFSFTITGKGGVIEGRN